MPFPTPGCERHSAAALASSQTVGARTAVNSRKPKLAGHNRIPRIPAKLTVG